MIEVRRDTAAAEEESSPVVQRRRVNISPFVQKPLALAVIYLSRLGVVSSVFAAALTQV
jgi:hypothetical protein